MTRSLLQPTSKPSRSNPFTRFLQIGRRSSAKKKYTLWMMVFRRITTHWIIRRTRVRRFSSTQDNTANTLKGCEKLGKIEVDMTDLRKELKLTKPKRKNAQPYYEIKLGVSLEINGRNLMASAEYPFKSGRIIPASVNYFSIAAAFQPGTE